MLQLSWRFFLAAFVMLSISRLLLSAWQWGRVRQAGGLWPVMLGGWRIDASFLAMVSGFPFLLAPWLDRFDWALGATHIWFVAWWLLLVLLEVSTPQFVIEYDTRPNRHYVEYLNSPREVSAMLWKGYKKVLIGAFLGLGLLAWVGWNWLDVHGSEPQMGWLGRSLTTLGLFVVLFLVGRGTLQHRPLNAAQVAFCNDSMVNSLPLNSTFTVINAIRAMRTELSSAELYGKLPPDEVQRRVLQEAGLPYPPTDPTYPSEHAHTATVRHTRPKRLVIIVEESLGAQFVGSLGGRGLTPSLDALGEQGWMLARTYATGTRSVRGLEAISTGFWPTPADAVLKLPRSQRGFFTLAGLLGQHGYHSRFIYGGEAHFDNMKGFFLGNGFTEVIDRALFKVKPGFSGSWGASDEDMFNELHQRLMDDGSDAVFNMAFSVSNHTPWEYPQGRIEPEGAAATVDNTVRYADWALGQFFERAKASPYWEDTVFLVVADHDARVSGASLVPVRHFHIPALILGGGIEPRRDERLISQADLAPTLLSLMGIDSVHPMPGADLTVSTPDRAIMQYGNNYGYLRGDQLLVLEPQRTPRQFRYLRDSHELEPVALDDELRRLAHAHALWPSWAYQNERYRVPPRAG
ncbi:LTA synthase family protein [Oleiagrimonas sp. C23AA]|uniref:LTA synthase family protein n=1 Tax=Oleiagrimonas sp. C23AA TaxID=2719047 RepID=UPI00141FD2A3|nr:LTA synthase family protein [Oleiagrimonas sp. C23AA]NII09729.1 LTA synthase family protein [Oleiagrimonas sp. C23AA]